MRPRLLDLFCGAGGAAMGYHRAGFDVVGVDLEPQPNFPFEFIQADAIEYLDGVIDDCLLGRSGHTVDAVHASPPCQAYSVLQRRTGKTYPELIGPTRYLLDELGVPYVIENVVGAPLYAPVKLCGSMFDLAVERHRLFETSFDLPSQTCDHARQRETWPEAFPALRSGREDKRARVVGVYGTGGGAAKDFELWKWAMGIDWMKTKHELAESIPPAYTEYVGRHLMEAVT